MLRLSLTLTLMMCLAAPAVAQPTTRPADDGARRFHLLYTSDIYGRFAWPGCGTKKREGADMSQLVTAVKRRSDDIRRAGDGRPLVVAGGSMIRPDAMGSHIFGEGRAWSGAAIALIKMVGFDAVAVGPYDFGARPDALEIYMKGMRRAGIPLLASNVTCSHKSDFRCRQLDRRYLVLDRGGLKVGVFAVARKDLAARILGGSAGSLSTSDPVEEARKLTRLLRDKEKVDLVVALANLNLETNAPEPALTFVRSLKRDAPDLVVADNMFYRRGDDFITRIQNHAGPPILGTDRFGQHLGHVMVRYRRVGSGVAVTGIRVEMQPIADLPAARRADRLVGDLRSEVCRVLHKPLGRARIKKSLTQAEFYDYVMEIMRNRAGAELALLNDSAVADTSFPMTGRMTRESVLRAIRTETSVGTFRMTGARIVKVIGPYITGAKEGLNIRGLTKKGLKWYVNNRPMLDGQHYKIAVTKFVASGGDGLISLFTERYRDSGFKLRRTVIDFFDEDRQSALDGDLDVNLERDFPDPWNKWVLYGESDLGLLISNVRVQNDAGYNLPLLKRDNLTTLTLDVGISGGASNRNHAVEADLTLQYGQTWTRTAGEESSTRAETADTVRGDFLYRFNWIRNRVAPGRWYLPVPYAEATVITEVTPEGSYCTQNCDDGDAENDVKETYRYLELGGTVGVGFLPHPYLFAKAGFAVSGELLTPEAALEEVGEERDARTGVYLGYKLRRLKLISNPHNPLQLESRLDYFATDLRGTRRQQLTLQSKLYFGLTPYLYVTASHGLYLFDNRCVTQTCAAGQNDVAVANDVAIGLDLLVDYRHQLF